MKKNITILWIALALFFSACEAVNFINCKYKVHSASDVSWAGINLSQVKQVSDLSPSDYAKALLAIVNNDYMLKLNMNVLASNDTKNDARIGGFDYIMLLNNKTLTTGENSNYKITVPANGGESKIPIAMNFDVKDILAGGGVEDMIKLTRNIINYGNGEPSDVSMKFRPWIPVGNLTEKVPYITLDKTFK